MRTRELLIGRDLRGPALLRAKAALAEDVLRERHLHEGLVIPVFTEVYARPEPRHLGLLGAIKQTAWYLAARSFQAAVEPSADASAATEDTLAVIEKAHAITGVPGVIARAYLAESEMARSDLPGQEGVLQRSDGYAWLSWTHLDDYTTVLFALAILHDLCVTPAQRPRLSSLAAAVADMMLRGDLSIKNVDETAVEGCNLAPGTIPLKRRVMKLQALQMLRIAHRLTGQPGYLAEYQRLAGEHEYAKGGVQLRPAGLWEPRDDLRAFEAYYHLLQCEDDPGLTEIYRRNLNANWARVREQERAYLDIIHQALLPEAEAGERVGSVLARMDVVKEVPFGAPPEESDMQPPEVVPVERRPPALFEWADSPARTWYGKTFFAPVDYLLAYWMGRYHGVIPPS